MSDAALQADLGFQTRNDAPDKEAGGDTGAPKAKIADTNVGKKKR